MTALKTIGKFTISYVVAWFIKGVALQALRQPEEALACYDHALALTPRNAQAWFMKGAVLGNNFQRYREALECFEEAQKLGLPQAAEAIAECREALGE